MDESDKIHAPETIRRRKAREATRLASIVDSSDDAIISKGLDGVVRSWNKAAERMFGYTAKEAIGQSIAALIIPDDRQKEEEDILQQLAQGKKIDHFETVRRRKDDSLIEISVTISPLYENGKIVGASKIARDITQQKQNEEALRKSESMKSTILEAALDCIITIDKESRVVDFNPAAEQTFGYSREEIIGERMEEYIVPPHLREAHRKGMQHYLKTGEGAFMDRRTEIKGMHADGTEFPIELSITSVQQDSGRTFFTAYLRDITERKQLEEALRKNEEGLKTDLASMRRLYKLYVGLASGTDLNAALNEILAAATQLSGTEHGTIQLVSDDDDRIEIAAHQGYSKDSRFIRHFLKAGSELACDRAFHERKRIIIENIETHPDFKGTKDREIALEEGIRAQQSTPMITRKGEAVGVLSTQFRQPHRPDKRELGLINLLAWTAAEFVERHHTDKALRESEERYRNLFESMDEGYCIIQMIFDKDDEPVDYRFLEMNPAFGKLTGLKNAEGKRMREMVPDHEEHWFENYGKVAKTGEPIRFENRAENLPNPSIYDVYAFRFGKPDERKVAILFKDVTEQKKANRKNAHLGAVVNNSDDAIISKDLNTIITSWNNGAENLFGYTEEEAIGEPVTIIMPEETMEETDIFLKRLERGESIDHFETIRRHKDGSILNVSLTISPVRDDNGEIVGASKIARDITEQKRQEKELNELNETLEDRVEKRTSALLSYQKQLRSLGTQLSKAEEKERRRLATSLHDNLGQMLAACKMQMDIIQKTGNLSNMGRASGLLDEAISHTRRLMSDLKPPPLLGKENIDSTLQWIAKKMKRYDLNVVLNSNGPPARLEEDVQIVLAQCTQELLFNVVKHANTNEVWVELSYPDSKIKIMVEDHGEGFDNKAQRELDLSKDSGFGLFNVRERIDMLGGRTDIVSKPGTGTKISLIVPTDDENAEASGRQKPDSGDLQAKQHPYRIKILLVDDHEIMRDGLKKIIEDENDLKVVAEASDGNNIVELARKTKPDVVIMDVNLPGSINGIEATQKIKTELPDIRVVGLSLYDDEKVAQNMRDAGAMAYLTKTEASEALCATIRSVAGAE